MLQVISALLIILDFSNVELIVLIFLISSHSILLDQSSCSSLILGQLLVELWDNIVNKLLNPRLNPIEFLSPRFGVVYDQNLFSLKEHEDIDGSDSMVLIVIELLPQLVLLEGQHFKPFVLFQRVSRE